LSASFSPDGARIVTASKDRTARLWDVTTGKEIFPPLRHDVVVTSAAFSADGGRIVTASGDGTARIWDAITGREIIALRGHEGLVRSSSFSSDGLHTSPLQMTARRGSGARQPARRSHA
jgi:WD40 repeat protein